ncbi:MAG: ABC transporter ATP-binding protein [Candidatus Handelsmanbacteria bacterium]|nr:ABC transporter ATP-binding protein [Candidatus Handelsmanbacteria bacterium]
MSFLCLRGLEKTYPDGTRAVGGIDLECGEGEFVVLLGPSGCGKTTTLRMVAGLETPTAGCIEVGGGEITSLPPGARDVGFVFQFYALYPHLRVRENVEFPLACMGVKKADRRQRASEVLQRLGLNSLAELLPEQLSGGDQQRVALARAMVRRPRLYLMDEPLGTLDVELRLELRELIRAQQLETGVTTLYVTHDQEEAMSLADRVVVMEGGLIRQQGPPDQVYDRPADLFVAHFIGSPGMNFIAGQVRAGRFAGEGWSLPLAQVFPDGPATLGVRPEYLRLDPEGPLRGRVAMDEYLGACRYLYLDTPAGRLAVRVEGEGGRAVGEEVGLSAEMGRVRLFDPATGRGR